jgi:hypothetical protein
MSSDGEQVSGPPEPRCEALCQGLHDTGVVTALQTISSGHQTAPQHMHAFYSYGALRVVTV